MSIDIAAVPFREHEGLLLVSKPSGIPTHSPGDGKEGFVELLTVHTGIPLKVCHRLDAETSGAMVFGITDEATKKICKLFEIHEVKKRYLFVTDRPLPSRKEQVVRSHIKKFRGRHVSWPNHEDLNSETEIRFLSSHGKLSLWEAFPKTGKPHQIRLHAKELKIPVLGDKMHGGSKFERLMLHADQLQFMWGEELLTHRAEVPEAFEYVNYSSYTFHKA